MAIPSKIKTFSSRSTGVLLLVGALAGVTVGGGVGVFAAASTKSVTVCANKTTNVLRYSKSGKCTARESAVVLNQSGADGDDGATGKTGAKGDTGKTGAKGDTGAAGATGAKGDTGATGATGPAGPAGSSGSGGGASAPIATGTNCVATKCTYKIGDTGPGGGLIFFVDYNDEYVGLNYLEAAPQGWSNGLLNVNLGGVTGEFAGTATVDPKMNWCSDTSTLLGLDAWSNSAVGTGSTNTATADTTCASGAIQAASDYAAGPGDWFLPSVGEAMLMYTNLRKVGVGGVASGSYWSSSEVDAGYVWMQEFLDGRQNYDSRASPHYVRPVRAF